MWFCIQNETLNTTQKWDSTFIVTEKEIYEKQITCNRFDLGNGLIELVNC